MTKLIKGVNDLATTNPELIPEWDEKLNDGKKIADYTSGSNKIIIWIKSYDDPKTGKHFDFVWSDRICNRTIKGYGCPYLSGQKVWVGFNDLATTNPELIPEWDEELNGGKKNY